MHPPLAANLAALVDMLSARDLEEPEQLRLRVRAHLTTIRTQEARGRLVDLGVAQSTGGLCLELLGRWPDLTDPQRSLVQAACLYFVEAGDDEDDLGEGGFDDDLEVAKWVAARLAASRST